MSSAAARVTFAIPPLPVRQFSVAEYHRMIDAGILTTDDAVELLEGWIVPKMTRKPPHDVSIELIRGAIGPQLPPGWSLRSQSAITTADSEPEPDLAVVRGEPRTYRLRHPGPADIGLLIEVGDATLGHDRREKGRVFARAGVPHYWIVNLVDGWIEVYSEPEPSAVLPAYRSRTDYQPGDRVPLILDGQTVATIAVADLLP